MAMRKTLFTIDGFDAVWEGYTDGKHWNGWACPYFTKEVADDIMRINNADNNGTEMYYVPTTDTYVRTWDDGNDEEFDGIDINGMHLYPIGNMCWIWDDLADYQSDQSKMVMEYLREEYFWLNSTQLYDAYYGIIGEIDGYMSDEQVKIFADGFMTAYDRRK